MTATKTRSRKKKPEPRNAIEKAFDEAGVKATLSDGTETVDLSDAKGAKRVAERVARGAVEDLGHAETPAKSKRRTKTLDGFPEPEGSTERELDHIDRCKALAKELTLRVGALKCATSPVSSVENDLRRVVALAADLKASAEKALEVVE